MNIENKKEHILRCIRLGMEFYQAALVAECTGDEIKKIEEDKLFARKIEVYTALEEYSLLQKHNTAMEMASARGSAVAIQWKLGKLNPKRWGDKEAIVITTPENITVNLVGKDSE